jgi:uncharacterized protein YbaP (TraB family)
MKRLMGVGILAVASVAWAQAPATASPAMWKVKGVHGTVYLFGSVHVMKPDVQWETAKVKDALKSSDVLYLEVAEVSPEDMQKLQPTIMEMGMDLQKPLSAKISKEDVAALDAAVKDSGLPGLTSEQAMEPMQPWLVYTIMSLLPAVKAGYKTDSGIDQKLMAESKGENKPVKGFESAEEQMHFLADMPQPEQVELLHQTLADLPKGEAEINEMVTDWIKGDVDGIAKIENGEMKTKSPALYAKLLVERNKHFTDVLAGLLKDPATGTVFVTIGAAHLAGPDSVQKMLEARGYTSVRVE